MTNTRCAVVRVSDGVVENVIIADLASFNPGEGFSLVANDIIKIGDVYDMNLNSIVAVPPTTDELIAYTKDKRREVETGGITVSGTPIATDRESQAMLNGAYSLSKLDQSRTFNWQTDTGFVTLDAAALEAMAVAVGNHVQACFDLARTLMDQINVGAVTTFADIDNAAWTSTY